MSHATSPASTVLPSDLHVADSTTWNSVQDITIATFGKKGVLSIEEDCEIAGAKYVRVDLDFSGELDDIAARNDAWHRRVSALPGIAIGTFRLIVNVG